MLRNSKAFSGFAVDDLDKAREFYGETLGLDVVRGERAAHPEPRGRPRDADLPEARLRARDLHDPQLPGRQTSMRPSTS